MNINYNSQHFTIKEGLKDYFEKKMERIEKYSKYINLIDAYFTKETHFFKVEVVLNFKKGKTLCFIAEEDDINASIDKVVDRVDQNLNKYKDKLVEHKEATALKYITLNTVNNENFDEIDRIDLNDLYKKPLAYEDALLNLKYNNKDEFIAFYNYEYKEDEFNPTIMFKEENKYLVMEKDNNSIKTFMLDDSFNKMNEMNQEIAELNFIDAKEKLLKNNNKAFLYRDDETSKSNILFKDKQGKVKVINIPDFQ